MSEWKVFLAEIEVFPHPNADKLALGRVGSYQVVFGKGDYKTGDVVCFAPSRSMLPAEIRKEYSNPETGESYLGGPNCDRVKSIRLRGQDSEGVLLPLDWVMTKVDDFTTQVEQDISQLLGIVEYIPEIHSVGLPGRKSRDGDVVIRVDKVVKLDRFVRHDVESFRIFQNEFIPGERVQATEKIHGSQINIIKDKYDRIAVTSKGRAQHNLVLRQYPKRKLWRGKGFGKVINLFKTLLGIGLERNEYWEFAQSSGLLEVISAFTGQEVQIIGEVVPMQKGFSYGFSDHKVLVFRLIVGTKELPYGSFDRFIKWVPLLYDGPYDLEKILPLAEGKETVSGHSLHLKEGIVLKPYEFRKTLKGVPLLCKILNPKYKEVNDDLR